MGYNGFTDYEEEPYVLTKDMMKQKMRQNDKNLLIVFFVGITLTLIFIGRRHVQMGQYNDAVILNNTQDLNRYINNYGEHYAFYYGTLSAKNPVNNAKFPGSFISIKRVAEEYTTYYDDDGYETSERKILGSVTKNSDILLMDGVAIPYNLVTNLPSREAYCEGDDHLQYRYIVTDDQIIGTVFIEMDISHEIKEVTMYAGQTIDSVMSDGASWLPVIIALICTAVLCVIVKIIDLIENRG